METTAEIKSDQYPFVPLIQSPGMAFYHTPLHSATSIPQVEALASLRPLFALMFLFVCIGGKLRATQEVCCSRNRDFLRVRSIYSPCIGDLLPKLIAHELTIQCPHLCGGVPSLAESGNGQFLQGGKRKSSIF